MQPSTTSVVVADAGPLIALGRLDLLHVLGELFDEVQVPEVVLAECLARPDLADAQRIGQAVEAGLLARCEAQPIEAVNLDEGERAAIGRAIEIRASLLVDDLAARKYAQGVGLLVLGTWAFLFAPSARGCCPRSLG